MLHSTNYGFSFRKFKKAAALIAISACSITSVWAQCSVTAPTVQNLCIGNPLSITASTVAGATYTWTGPNGFSATTTNPTVAISNSAITSMSGNYTVKVTVGACTSPVYNSYVNVWANAQPVINSAQCFQAGAPSTISVGNSNLYNAYRWTTPAGYTMTNMSASTAAIFGTFATNTASQFSVYSENGSCPNSPTTTFTMYPKPQPTISAAKYRMCKDENVQLVASISGGTWSITSTLPALTGGATTQSTVSATTGLFTGNNPGVFKVRYTVTVNGCAGYSEQDITVGALPFTITGPANMCQYQSQVYTVVQPGVGNSYSWKVYQNPNIPISGPSVSNFNNLVATLNTSYTSVGTVLNLSATGAFECIAATGNNPAVYKYSDANKLVTVVPNPSNFIIKCADNNCNQLTIVDKTTGTAVAGVTYEWTFGSSTVEGTSQTFTNPKNQPWIYCNVKNANGCVSQFYWRADYTLDQCNRQVYNYNKAYYCNQNYTTANCTDPTRNLRKAENSYQLVVYPNPATSNISFLSEGLEGNATIYNFDGVVVKSIPLNKDETMYNVNISSLSAGIYVLRVVSSNGQSHSTPIIKE